MRRVEIERVEFRRLNEIEPARLIALMNDPDVRRHLPLARGRFGAEQCARFVEAKERMWKQRGYGPWGFVLDGEFIGWGGLQPEGDDADVGLVLRRTHWGLGRLLYSRILSFAFDELGLESVIALLPPSRRRGGGLSRRGFLPDGEVSIDGQRFHRYRLHRPATLA